MTTFGADGDGRIVWERWPGGKQQTYFYQADGLMRAWEGPWPQGRRYMIWDGSDYVQERD